MVGRETDFVRGDVVDVIVATVVVVGGDIDTEDTDIEDEDTGTGDEEEDTDTARDAWSSQTVDRRDQNDARCQMPDATGLTGLTGLAEHLQAPGF